jgi:segregation and condensation protein A
MFDGPFDLLLFFIERDELDVHDIPIARITNDFLAYLKQLETRQIEISSEFIVMAAQLMKIKALALLPRPQVNEQGEVIDPRTELIDQLFEYKKYRLAAERISELETQAALSARRAFAAAELQLQSEELSSPEDDWQGISTYRLFAVYKNVLEKHRLRVQAPAHVIQRLPYTPDQIKADVLQQVSRSRRVDFVHLVNQRPEKLFVVFCFLCILELIQQRLLRVIVGDGNNNFWLLCAEPAPTALGTVQQV